VFDRAARSLLRHPGVARNGTLASAASAIHQHEVFKALRIGEDALKRIITGAAQALPREDPPLIATHRAGTGAAVSRSRWNHFNALATLTPNVASRQDRRRNWLPKIVRIDSRHR
jgi:hypothetical protein